MGSCCPHNRLIRRRKPNQSVQTIMAATDSLRLRESLCFRFGRSGSVPVDLEVEARHGEVVVEIGSAPEPQQAMEPRVQIHRIRRRPAEKVDELGEIEQRAIRLLELECSVADEIEPASPCHVDPLALVSDEFHQSDSHSLGLQELHG